MQRIAKFAGWIVLASSVLLLLAFITLKAITDEQYRSMITSGVELTTGRELNIAGDFSLSLTSSLSLVASDISFANADWGSRPEMFSLRRIETELNLLALFRGVLELRLLAEAPDLLLEKDEQGRANWVMGLSAQDKEVPEPNAEKSVGGFSLQPNIRNFVLSHGKFAYRDSASEQNVNIRIDNIGLGQDAEALQVDFKGAYNDIPFSISGELSDLVQLLRNGSTPLQFMGQTDKTQLTVNGTVGLFGPDLDLDMAVDLQSSSLADFSLFTEAAIPDLGPLSVSLDLTGKKGLYSLKDMEATLDSDKMKADISGSVLDLVQLDGIKLQANVETNSLPEIIAQTDVNLGFPLPPAVTAKVSVQGSRDVLVVKDFLLDCSDKGIQVQVNGTAENIVKLDRIKAQTAISTESLSILSRYAQTDLPDTGPLKVFAVLTSRDGLFSLAESSISLNDKHLQAKIDGTVEDLQKLRGVNADIDIKLDTLSSLNTLLDQDLPDSGRLALKGTLINRGGAGMPTTIAATLNGEGVRIKVDGTMDEIINASSVKAKIEAELDSLSLLSKYLNNDLSGLGKLNLSADIASTGDTYALSNIKADLAGPQHTVSVVGSVGDLLKFRDVSANIDLNLESLSEMSTIARTDLPDLGPFKASAEIVSRGDTLTAQKLTVDLADEQLQGNISGSIGDLLKFQGVSANIDLNLESLSEMSTIARTDLPDLGPLKASANIASSGDIITASNVTVNLADEQLQINVTGSVGDLLNGRHVNAFVDLNLESLNKLSQMAKVELPDLGPLKASANIASSDDVLTASDVTANIADEQLQVNVTGSVGDLLKMNGINADIMVAVDTLSSLNELVGKKLPDSGPLTLQGNIGSKSGFNGPTTLSLDLAAEGVEVNIDGNIGNQEDDRKVEVAFGLDAESLARVGRLAGVDLPPIELLRVNSKLSMNGSTFKAEDIYAKLGNSDLRGEIGFTPADGNGSRPLVTGRLDFGELELPTQKGVKDSQPEEAASDERKSIEGQQAEVKNRKLFSGKPFPFDVLKTLNAELSLKAQRLDTYFFVMEDIDSRLRLEDGMLTILPTRARVGDGTFDAWLQLDTNWQPAKMSTRIKMDGTTFKNFGGKVNLDADLDGSGDSIASLMAGLDGQFILQVNDAELKKTAMTNFGVSLFDSINPFAEEEETTLLECAIARLVITDGLVDMNKKIAAQTTKVSWFGNGQINLKTEEFGIGINPIPRKGFGISGGTLAKLVGVGGTLANPKLLLDSKQMATLYGSYSIAVATGGLSLLVQRFMQRRKANSDVCAEILEEALEENDNYRLHGD